MKILNKYKKIIAIRKELEWQKVIKIKCLLKTNCKLNNNHLNLSKSIIKSNQSFLNFLKKFYFKIQKLLKKIKS